MAQPDGLAPQYQAAIGSASNAAVVAGGALAFTFGTLGLYIGSGSPTVSATKGSLYLRTDGSSASTRVYVNNGTTTWVAVTTAS